MTDLKEFIYKDHIDEALERLSKGEMKRRDILNSLVNKVLRDSKK